MTWLENYSMLEEQNRKAFIINNEKFDRSLKNLPPRTGSLNDQKELYAMFNNMGFADIKAKSNLTVKQMQELFEKTDFKDTNCIACAILSYGDEGHVYGTDDRIELSDLFDTLKKCPSLVGKPKIFFIQSCSPTGHDGQGEDETIPIEADTFTIQCTYPISMSQREGSPSILIESLVDAYKRFPTSDLLTLSTRLTKLFAKKMYRPDRPMSDLPIITSTLTKEVFFKLPPIEQENKTENK